MSYLMECSCFDIIRWLYFRLEYGKLVKQIEKFNEKDERRQIFKRDYFGVNKTEANFFTEEDWVLFEWYEAPLRE